jgi:hypothetical protein
VLVCLSCASKQTVRLERYDFTGSGFVFRTHSSHIALSIHDVLNMYARALIDVRQAQMVLSCILANFIITGVGESLQCRHGIEIGLKMVRICYKSM